MNKNKKYFLIYVVNILLGLLYISPLIWMVVSAFKPENRIFADMSKGLAAFWPAGATLDNFKEVFVRSNMPRYILNSVTYVTILVFLSMAVNSAFGYALAKFEFKGKNVILTVVLSLLVLPLESILLSLFFIVNKLGWVDSYLALIIPFIVKCFDVYLFRQFFLDVPDDLIEAAEIDGAAKWDILWKIRVPMVMSSITICVFLTLTNSFKLFDQNLALTGGDPNHATEMLALNIYQTFYARAGMQWKGYGQAKAVIFCVLVIIISLVQLKATRRCSSNEKEEKYCKYNMDSYINNCGTRLDLSDHYDSDELFEKRISDQYRNCI